MYGAVAGDQRRDHHRFGYFFLIGGTSDVESARVETDLIDHLGDSRLGNASGDPLAQRQQIGRIFRSVFTQCQGGAQGLAIRIQQIPAPTFAEAARAGFVRAQMEALCPGEVEIDDLCNVYVRIPGRAQARPIVVSAHLDTVFPEGTPLDIVETDDRIAGPGIGDNSLAVAGLFGVAQMALAELEPAWREFLADDDFFALDALLLRAYRSAREGDLLQSLSGAEAVLAQDPERLAAHRLVAQANLELGDFAGARRHFEKLVEKHPEEFAARLGLGQAVLGAAEDAAACLAIAGAALERAAAGTEETAALFLLCDAAEATGDVRGALQCVRRLLAQPDLSPAQKDALRDREARLMRDRARSGE